MKFPFDKYQNMFFVVDLPRIRVLKKVKNRKSCYQIHNIYQNDLQVM